MDSPTPQPKSETKPLTPKQRAFVEAYCGPARFNASKAALHAGYSVRQSGHELLSNPVIRARIDHELNARALTGAEILRELTDVAMRGLDECVEVRAYGDDVTAKMDAHAKMKALELLGKSRQLFVDRQVIEGDLIVRQYVGIDPDTFDDVPAGDDA